MNEMLEVTNTMGTEDTVETVKTIETHKYMTYKELLDVTRILDDERDRLLLLLLFDGFYVELDNLQYLRFVDLKGAEFEYLGVRKISKATSKTIIKALSERNVHTYSSHKGGIDELIPSDFILRERLGYKMRADIEVNGRFNGFAMNKTSIINRFTKLKQRYKFNFSMSSLYASGVIHRGKQVVQNKSNPKKEFVIYVQDYEKLSRARGYLYYKEYEKLKVRTSRKEN